MPQKRELGNEHRKRRCDEARETPAEWESLSCSSRVKAACITGPAATVNKYPESGRRLNQVLYGTDLPSKYFPSGVTWQLSAQGCGQECRDHISRLPTLHTAVHMSKHRPSLIYSDRT